jgi:lysophospholipase L1-like esterase
MGPWNVMTGCERPRVVGEQSAQPGRTRPIAAALLCLALSACGGSPTRPSTVVPPTTTLPPTGPTTPVQPPTPVPPAPTLRVSRILCFGDSLTEGYIASTPRLLLTAPADAYPYRLQLLLTERYRDQRILVENAGRSGEWAADGQYRIVGVLESWRPDAVVLMEGANDLNNLGRGGLVVALDALENMLRDARARGAQVVLASLPPERSGSTDGGAASLVVEFNSGVQRLAERQRVLFVDVYRAFQGDLSLIGPDGLHPTPAGYQRIAQAVFDVLRSSFEGPLPTTTTE